MHTIRESSNENPSRRRNITEDDWHQIASVVTASNDVKGSSHQSLRIRYYFIKYASLISPKIIFLIILNFHFILFQK